MAIGIIKEISSLDPPAVKALGNSSREVILGSVASSVEVFIGVVIDDVVANRLRNEGVGDSVVLGKNAFPALSIGNATISVGNASLPLGSFADPTGRGKALSIGYTIADPEPYSLFPETYSSSRLRSSSRSGMGGDAKSISLSVLLHLDKM